MKTAKALPLSGVRVLDLTQIYAGPYCAMLLGFLGAEVIKIESRNRLVFTRRQLSWRQLPAGDVYDAKYDLQLGKMAITLDLTKPKATELVKRLVKITDVFLENSRPGVMAKLGLGYDTLSAVSPGLVMLSLSLSGGKGPESQHRGFAPTFHAMSGLDDITGYRDGPPSHIRQGGDMRVGTVCAFAVLAALNNRKRTGRGELIDLSCLESIECLIGDVIMDYIINRRVATREGNRDSFMAPHNCYPCREEGMWVSIAIATDAEWESLCRVMGSPAWAEDPRFYDQLSRWENQDELDVLVGEWTKQYTHREVMQVLQQAGVAAVPSFSSQDLYEDPHLAERQFSTAIEHPEAGRQIVIGPPWKLSATPACVRSPAPGVGQHNDYVFQKLLGLSPEETRALAAEGVIS